jgi:alpha-D-xyloside xylohydrolase
MDFREDKEVLGTSDQFLFGPSLLVNPVTTRGATRRDVYLPGHGNGAGAGAGWYDFWTGAHHPGGRRIDAPAPYESLPLYVKAGSILPMGPELQHTGEKPADPLTLWVYTGADASFELYEDDGVSYGYEQGLSSTIPLRWDEAKAALTIGARQGSFPGMLSKREIRIVFVTRDQTVPHSPAPRVARTVVYDGGAVVVKAKAPPA